MKTPQEIRLTPAQTLEADGIIGRSPDASNLSHADWTGLRSEIERLILERAAAREEGRREGVNSAIQIGRSPCPDRNCTAGLCPTQAEEIRALASQPKPESVDHSRGVRIELTDEQRAALTLPDGAIPKPVKNPQRTADYMARMAPLEKASGFADTKPERLNTREAVERFIKEGPDLDGEPEPAVTCEGCKRGLPQTLRLGVLSHYDMDARPQFTRCTK